MQYFKVPIKVINLEEYESIKGFKGSNTLKEGLIESALKDQVVFFVAGLGMFIPSTVDDNTITYMGFGADESIVDITISVEEFEKALQG